MDGQLMGLGLEASGFTAQWKKNPFPNSPSGTRSIRNAGPGYFLPQELTNALGVHVTPDCGRRLQRSRTNFARLRLLAHANCGRSRFCHAKCLQHERSFQRAFFQAVETPAFTLVSGAHIGME